MLVIGSCKKDDSTNDPIIDTGDVIINETVSTQAVVLTSGNFSLSIPEGTFSSTTEVKISKLEETPYSADAITPLYFLNDLPTGTSKPMKVSLDGLNLNESFTVLMAEVTYVKSLDTTTTIFRKTDYVIEDGKVVVTIDRTPYYYKSTQASDEKLTIGLMAAKSQQTILSNEGHFSITCPVSKLAKASSIAQYLEEAYTRFSTAPFSFDYSARTSWPMSVTLLPMDNSMYGEQVSSVWGDNYASISFNSNKLDDMPEMRITAGHEFFHFVQSLYDPRSGFSKAKFESAHYWLDEAASAWVEEYFTDIPGYVSKTRTGNEPSPFEGSLNEAKPDARGYGYGMSAALKYIAGNYGEVSIRSIYEQIRLNKEVGEAIRLGLGRAYDEWYGKMIRDYGNAGLYSDVTTAFMVGSKSDEFNINSENDTVKTFSASFPSLGSKVYSISIKPEALDDESALSVVPDQTFSQWISLYRFKTGSSAPEIVGSGNGVVTVNDLKSMVTEGYRFLLVFTNQYYSSGNEPANLSFKVRVTKKQLFKAFSFYLMSMCHHTTYYNTGNPSHSYGNWVSQGFTEIPVTQIGNILTASWDGIYGANPSKGDATITINEDKTVTAVIHQETDAGSVIMIMNCKVNSIPLNISNWYADTYQADESVPYIESLYWKETYSGFYIEIDDFYQDPQYPGKFVRLDLFK
jgi:hypothetical protein